MRRLVQALSLAPGAPAAAGGSGSNSSAAERLVPEETRNPMLQRFYYVMGKRALDQTYEVRALQKHESGRSFGAHVHLL